MLKSINTSGRILLNTRIAVLCNDLQKYFRDIRARKQAFLLNRPMQNIGKHVLMSFIMSLLCICYAMCSCRP